MSNYSDALESRYRALGDSVRAKAEGYECDGFRRSYGAMERSWLRKADTYYWASDIVNAVRHSSMTLPPDTALSFDRFPHGYAGWFWLERPVVLAPLEAFQGMLWTVHDIENGKHRVLSVTSYAQKDGYLQSINTAHCDEGRELSEVESDALSGADISVGEKLAGNHGLDGIKIGEGKSAAGLLRMLIAQILWIEQQIVVAPREQAVRATRRRLPQVTDHGIKVVRLRRAVSRPPESSRMDAVEWSCQWVVRGHWRQQYYPKTGERSPIWIMPYVKGPEDAPLKTPSPTVFAVTR